MILNNAWNIMVGNTGVSKVYAGDDVVWSKGASGDTFIYGWHVDPNIPNSSDAITYLDDAVGMIPAKMGSTSFDYGSWKNAFFMPRPCMLRYDGTVAYYLDPDDYSRKLDGTPSDIANPDFKGNAMMEWGLLWYKFEGGTDTNDGYFYVSNKKVDNSYKCWCNVDSQNNITPHFYTAIYNGTGTTKLRSLSGVELTVENGNGNTTCTQEVKGALANNTTDDVEWYTDVWCDRLLINALLVLMGKSLNTQAVFGRGLDTGSESAKKAYTTGTFNDKGMFWGVTANGDSGVKVFGMENWWGCVWRRTAGCISVNRELDLKLTYGTADGSTASGYNQTGDGYINDGTIPSVNGYVQTMRYTQYGYMTSLVYSGGWSTYYVDYFYQDTGTRYMMVGGNTDSRDHAGAFCFNLLFSPQDWHWGIAAALSCKPLRDAHGGGGTPVAKTPYLHGSGTQYIDTGITGSSGTDVEITLSRYGGYSGWCWAFAASYANADRAIGVGINEWEKTTLQRGTGFGTFHDDDYTFVPGERYVIKTTGGALYINGEKICEVTDSTFTAPVTVTLLAANAATGIWGILPARLYGARLWQDGELVRDMTPALDADGVPCMYDSVSGGYFYNSGSGQFEYGEEWIIS